MQEAVNYGNQFLVIAVFALSLNLLTGYGGIFSACHAGLGAVGGYTFAYLFATEGYGFWVAALAAIVIATFAGLLVAIPAVRLEALWLVLLTLAVQIVISNVPANVPQFGGPNGILISQGFHVNGRDLTLPTQLMPVLLVVLVVVFAIAWRIGESPYGRVLRGIRDDQVAARSLGRNIVRYKVALFALTGAAAGLGGVVLTMQTNLASPSMYNFNISIQIISIVIIGGIANLWGSLIGSAVVVGATPFFLYVVKLDTDVAGAAQTIAYGLVLVLVVSYRPRGLVPEGVSPVSGLRQIARAMKPGARARAATDGLDATMPMAPPVAASAARKAVLTELVESHPGSASGVSHHRSAPDRSGEHGDSVLEISGLTKSFGGIHAVDGLSLNLRRGLITALVGPNGAGKTTVFNLITGAISPDAGIVRLNGKDITGRRPDEVARMGMVRTFQDVRIFPDLSVTENVMLGVQGHPGEHLANLFLRPGRSNRFDEEARARAEKWLEVVGLTAARDLPAGGLGFGQQKLLAIARALATEAEVLLLDEPASAIDISWVNLVLDFIETLKHEGRTICLVEHSLHVVGRLADHVCFMELGKVTAEGTLDELTADSRLAEAYFGSV